MTALAILAAAAALSFSQSNDVCVAKVKVSPTGRTCLTAAYRGERSAPGRFSILGPDGKIFWLPVIEIFDLRGFEWQDGKYVGNMVEIDPNSEYAQQMVEVNV